MPPAFPPITTRRLVTGAGYYWTVTLRAVLLDFYGTLGESDWEDHWMESVLSDRGYRFEDWGDQRWSDNAWDGQVHDEHSRSEAHYRSWQSGRWKALLRELDVAEGDLDVVVEAFHERRGQFQMRAYPETVEVLQTLRDRGLKLAICSNWDWDLDRQLRATGVFDLVDARVSSAWVGARKPHPRIFEATLAEVGVAAADAVFVGDNWRADVEGPLAAGMQPVHVWRHDEHPGDWIPRPPDDAAEVPRIKDLRGLLDLV